MLPSQVRVGDLERDRDQKNETIRKMEEVHTKRADGLLATIEDLQSEVEKLVEQLAKERASCPCKCKACGEDDAGCACVTPALAVGKSCQREPLPIASTVNHSSVEQDEHRESSQKKLREKDEEKRQPRTESTEEQGECTRATVQGTCTVQCDSPDQPAKVDGGSEEKGPVPSTDDDSWTKVVRRINRKNKEHERKQSDRPSELGLRGRGSKRGLRGAERVSIGVYHLSGIDLDCTVDDVIHHCKKKGILATACFMLKRRALHTTQTAKLYVRDDPKILEDGFWPDFLKCRPWKQSPPERVVSPSSQ